jgi:hypothetical protein
MRKEISRKVEIVEIPESKKFRTTLTIVDELDPEDMVSNLNGLRQTIKSEEDTLNIKQEQIEADIKKNKEIEAAFAEHENHARLWSKQNELLAKRTGKEVGEIQDRNAEQVPESPEQD